MERDFCYSNRMLEKKNQLPFISQTDLVYELLRDDVLLRYRRPGSRVNQDQLANTLGVSRSPVRDAINRLIEEGILVKRSRNGYCVYILTMKDATHIAEFRTAIEVNAGLLATRRATDQDLERMRQNLRELAECGEGDLDKMIALDTGFHDLLVACSKNEYMIGAYRQYAAQFRHLRNSTMTASMRDRIIFRHENILTAMANKDAVQIETAIRVHMQNNLEDSIEAIEFSYE